MVKTILIDGKANEELNKLLSNCENTSKTGLLIGTFDQNRDLITNIVSSPIDCYQNDNQDQINYDLVLNYALLVHEMLIGGCDILGIYTIDMSASVSKQILTKLFRSLRDFDYYNQMKFNTERLVFLVDSKSKNINMKCLDISNQQQQLQQTLQSCEIKIQNDLCKEFFILNSNYNLESIFKTPNVKSHNLLRQDLLNALLAENVLNENKYICLINNILVDENKSFSESNLFKDASELFANLMENLNEPNKKQLNQDNLESIYELNGNCNLIVKFHKSFKFKYIKKLLCYDLLRSFNARVRLLVEDLDARKDIIGDVQLEEPNSNDVSSIEESYRTPNRIHIYLDNGKFILSDYVFPDETDSDISLRIKEMFNYEILDPSKEIEYVEDLPPEIKMSKSESINERQEGSNTNSNSSSLSNLGSIKSDSNSGILNKGAFYMGAILVGVASIAITYYSYIAAKYLNEDSDTGGY